ncbi:MAG: hypothetical protein K2N82_15145 [Lachnospiraceae bacterium]|nr:hypothetical protein [Lachnospiraceae bacterium]
MMIKKGMLLIMLIIASVSMENSGKEEMERDAKSDMTTGDYCDISDFEDFHYYLFCNTNINLGTTPKVINAFIGNEGETMETGIELYQKFMEPLRTDEHEENMELYYISPDCKLAVTREEPVRGDHMITRWSSFDGGEAQNVKEIDSRDRTYFHITKSGDTYTVVDGETFYKKEDRLYEQTGYYCVHYNEQGDLGVGYKYEYDELGESTQKMAIFDLESTEVLWTFYQGEEKDGYVWQIQGDKESGKVIFDVENRYYYEFTYPSGEIRYLGTDMYCPCYSPDGKYIAYSSPCSADWNDVDEKAAEEMERILPGIYILEVETGKTAYIKQDMNDIHWAATLEFRSFQWVEKDCFEKVMKERDAKTDMTTGNYCGMDEFEELNYYLFCDSQLHEGAGGFTFRPSIIGSETQTIEEAKQLYQEFAERLPLDFEEKETKCDITYVSDVSPDCKCVITSKWSEHETMRTQILFYEKEKVREEVNEIRVENYPMLIVKDGDSYREMDEEHYEMLSELKKESYDEGYLPIWRINAEGNLLAGVRDNSLLTIREIEEGAEQWSFSVQGIQEEVAQIRDDIQEGDTVFVTVEQFEGDEKEGWLTVQAGRSSFFRIAYPSGEVTYLGEYMYSACFSPDGKYVAYSSDADYDDEVDMEQEEYERMKRICPPGICVREVETGKTAYLYWDPNKNPEEDFMEYRCFVWIEKEGFEEYMAESWENEEFVKRVNESLLIIMDTVVEQLVMRMKS